MAPLLEVPVSRFIGFLGRRIPEPPFAGPCRRGPGWAVYAEAAPDVGVVGETLPVAFVVGHTPQPPHGLSLAEGLRLGAENPAPDAVARAAEDGAGSFAVCAIDGVGRRLHLVRDAPGSRRLYLRESEAGLAFSNDLRLLLEASGRATPDPLSLFMFLEHLHVPAPFTPFEGVRQLLPGERREYDLESRAERARSVRLRDSPRLLEAGQQGGAGSAGLRGEEAEAALDRGLRDAMRLHCQGADRPSLLLSGGKDSGSLLLAAPPERRRDLTGLVVASPDAGQDESELAARLASELGHPCEVLRADIEGMRRALSGDFSRSECPVGDPTALAFASLAPQIAARTDRILDGTGNDSLFGVPVSATRERSLWLRHLPGRRLLGRPFANRPQVRRLLRPAGRFFLAWDGLLPSSDVRHPGLATEARWDEALAVVSEREPMAQRTAVVTRIWEPSGPFYRSVLLARAVRAELRFPWLGARLSEALLRCDRSELCAGATNKIVLRRWLEGNAPDYVVRKPKGFFSLPLERILDGLQDELRHWEARPEDTQAARVGVPAPVVGELAASWRALPRRVPTMAVWALVVLERWLAARDEAGC